MTAQTYQITWQGISIKLRYTACRWGQTAHLEIESRLPKRTPLPISETGYLSYFLPVGELEAMGQPLEALVINWLDKAAQGPAWQAYQERARQSELF